MASFYYPIKLYIKDAEADILSPNVSILQTSSSELSAILTESNTGIDAGMYVRSTVSPAERWRIALTQEAISRGVIDGDAITIYVNPQAPITVPAGARAYANSVPITDTVLAASNTVYAIMTPPASGGGSGTIIKVEATAGAGDSLIADDGSVSGIAKVKTIEAGSNITIVETATELTISSTGGGGSAGVSSLNSLTGDVSVVGGGNITVTEGVDSIQIAADVGVTDINSMDGSVNIVAGDNISVVPGTGTLTIASTAPVARTLVAGTNISLDNSTAGQTTISSSSPSQATGADGLVQYAEGGDFASNAAYSFDPATGIVSKNGSDFASNLANPAYKEGRVFYDADSKTLAYYNDVSGLTHNVGQESWLRVRNVTGTKLLNGQAVYISGSSGGWPTVSLGIADADGPSLVVGLLTADVEDGAIGYTTSAGIVHDLDTSAWAEGAELFLSDTVEGALVDSVPTGSSYVVSMGSVVTSDAVNGSILVNNVMRYARAEQVKSVASTHVASTNVQDALTELGDNKLEKDGSVAMTGNLNMGVNKVISSGVPEDATDLVNKAYVDSLGAHILAACDLATAAALPTYTAAGAETTKTLTANANGALTVDGVSVTVSQRILNKNSGSGTSVDNGIYVVTTAGDAGTPWVLTRADDANTTAELPSGSITFVTSGTVNANTGWGLVTLPPITMDTTPLQFSQTSGGATTSAGAGLTKVGNTISANFGAGIVELPTGYIGADVDANGGLLLSTDGSTPATTAAAKLSVRLANGTLSKDSTGLKVASSSITGTELATSVAGAGLTGGGGVALAVGTADVSRITVGANAIDLATTGVAGGTYNSLTVDTYGRVTAGSNVTKVSSVVAGTNVTVDNTDPLNPIVSASSGGTVTPGGADTQVQYNNAGAFGGAATLTFNGSNTLKIGDGSSSTDAVIVSGTSSAGNAQGLTITGANDTSGNGGAVSLAAGQGSLVGGAVYVSAGNSTGTGVGGQVTIAGGAASTGGAGGSVYITGGDPSATTDGGDIRLFTGALGDADPVSRLRITPAGAFAIGSTTNWGTAGQLLSSQGSGTTPTWIDPPSSVTTFYNKGSLSGSTAQTFDYAANGKAQGSTVTGAGSGAITITGFPTGEYAEMFVQATNWGLATLNFGTGINWKLPDGTTTTSISAYLTAIGRTSLVSSGVDFFYFWSTTGTTIYGKLL